MTMWKKLLTVAALSTAFASVPAHAAFLTNWYFQPDGTAGTQTLINEYLDIVGPSYVQTTTPVAGAFTFNEYGAVHSVDHDGGTVYAGNFSSTGEITALFSLQGSGTLGGAITFTGGAINIYSDVGRQDFGTATAPGTIYGANNGTLIGTFDVVFGGGTIDPTGIPNGTETLAARALFLATGYWLGPDGTTDLSGLAGPTSPLFGFTTTNASRVGSTSDAVKSDIVGAFGGNATYTDPGCLPGEITGSCTGDGAFVISNNGQERLTIPEPGSLALFGLSVFLLGAFARRRVS
jgi:hypothetical protein